MATELIEAPNEEALRHEIDPVLAKANAFAVSSPAEYQAAVDFLKDIKAAQNRVSEVFDPLKKAAHEAHKQITATAASFLDPLKQAEQTVKGKATAYHAAEERKRQEEQRKLQAAADEAARKERERLEKEAAKLKTPEKKQERLEQAAAVVAPVVAMAPSAPKAEGVAMRTTWKARVVNAALVPRDYLIVNEKLLNDFAKSTKGSMSIPGVEFYPEQSMAVGGR